MRLFLAAIFIGFLSTPSAIAQTFGLSVGGNFQRLSDITLDELNTRFESQTGWHAGAWLELPLGTAALRAGGRYMSAGQLLRGIQASKPRFPDNFDISMVELYLLFRLGVPSQILSPYVFAGPVFRIPTNTDLELSNDLHVLSYAGEIGGGIAINMGAISLYPEVAYIFGLTRFIKDKVVVRFIELQVEDAQRLNMAMLRLSVGF